MESAHTFTAFAGEHLLVTGDLPTMLRGVKEHLTEERNERRKGGEVLIFDDDTGRQVDFDFRGTHEEVLARALPAKPRAGPGRPKLGVVSREVSLLPRHWEWLEEQPEGISATLRRLVDVARKYEPGKRRARAAREAASRFMWAMAGNQPGFEEASRALFAKDQERFEDLVHRWPRDVRKHLTRLVEKAVLLEGSENR